MKVLEREFELKPRADAFEPPLVGSIYVGEEAHISFAVQAIESLAEIGRASCRERV